MPPAAMMAFILLLLLVLAATAYRMDPMTWVQVCLKWFASELHAYSMRLSGV